MVAQGTEIFTLGITVLTWMGDDYDNVVLKYTIEAISGALGRPSRHQFAVDHRHIFGLKGGCGATYLTR